MYGGSTAVEPLLSSSVYSIADYSLGLSHNVDISLLTHLFHSMEFPLGQCSVLFFLDSFCYGAFTPAVLGWIEKKSNIKHLNFSFEQTYQT